MQLYFLKTLINYSEVIAEMSKANLERSGAKSHQRI